jgi:hypothetical protein
MHDLIYVVAFVAMIASPAMVAAFGGRKDSEPGPELPAARPKTAVKIQPAPRVRPRSERNIVATAGHSLVFCDGPTLPMHNARGMANR